MPVESKEIGGDGMKIILKQQELDNDDPPPMEDQDETVEESVSTWRVCLMGTINNKVFAVILIFLTIYALFGDDIRLAASEKPDDAIFFTISIIALAFFTIELLVNMVAKPGYVRITSHADRSAFWSLYFEMIEGGDFNFGGGFRANETPPLPLLFPNRSLLRSNPAPVLF